SYKVSLNQLEGSLSNKVRDIGDILLAMIAHVEVSIDFPDHEVDEITYEEMKRDGSLIKKEIENLLSTSDRGKILRDGLNTIILGKPNVGKSSLLNAVLRENRAIVTNIPGTTRDIIEEFINIDGIPLKIVDTAGIRHTEDLVEKIGVDRAKDTVEKADLIIAVFDASIELSDEDYSIIELIKDKKTIALLNKTDLDSLYDEDDLKKLLNGSQVIPSSITTGIGVDILESSIKDMFYSGEIEIDSDIIINNMRHKNQLELALENINSALKDIEALVPLDCIEVDLRNCWENLGEITGDSVSEDIIDKIFAEFCLGK
ncbi:MAG: tRNA uridine-5-carboxymethylaminomethyl(34) synthesis GTPase MnmE, partial [Tissierellia bacterium]|nr:tRNA uridine-5-carboxymethylaminomethyl(34) synthesis GTPase MnmE [Tissierellia bacterium]